MDHGQFGVIDYVVLFLYFGAMASLGPFFASKARTTEGYFLGDRSFPGWLVGFSMFATSISSVTFMAFPADGYKAAWYRLTPSFMLPVAVLFASIYFLPFFRRTKITSAYEYLEDRFGPKTRVYAASAFIVGQVFRVSTILYLVSFLVYSILQVPDYLGGVYACILIGGIITVFYTALGGIRAVMWTDFTQAMVLWVGGIICLFAIVTDLPGGFGQVISEGWAAGKFSFTMDYSAESPTGLAPVKGFSLDFTDKTVLLLMLVGLGNWMTEYSANQNVIQRYAASKSAHQARVAMWVCAAFSVPTWIMFYFVGTALWVFYQHFPSPETAAMLTGAGGAKAEEVLPHFIITRLPAGVTGLVIAAVLAAAMSSLSSSINAVSAVGIVDIYKRHMVRGQTDRHYVFVAKSISVGLGVIMVIGATLLYELQTTTLQDIGTVLAALTAGGLWGLYMLGFFTKRGIDGPVLFAIGCTLLFTLWMTLGSMKWLPAGLTSPIHPYYAGIIGHVLMFVSGYLFARLAVWLYGSRFQRRDEALHNLTVWTADTKPLD
jgi:solute:Na+ symporter, SSS family